MSYNLYDLDNGLADKDALDFGRKAILYNREDINKVVTAGNEKLTHFITKAIMFYALSELDHDIVTECTIVGVGRVDMYDLTAQVIYEFENHVSPKYRKEANEKYRMTGVEMIVIDINVLPDDIFQRYLKLREYVVVD